MKTSRVALIGGLLLVLGPVALLVWRLQPGRALVAAPGQELRYGHFGFTVEGVRRAASIGEGGAALVSSGEFVIVTLGVHNHSEHGDLSFPPSAARLIASDGTAYTPDEAGTAALAAGDAAAEGGRRCTGPIRAGDSCIAEVAFDVPPGTRGERLDMQFEGPLFELVEMLINGRRWMELPE